jgi:predicted Holliday junction resolvase-like endonuclease
MSKNILQRGKVIMILLFCFLLCSCSIENINEKIVTLDIQIGEELEKLESKDTESVVDEEEINELEVKKEIEINDDIKKQVENWIEDNDLNRYGDIVGTIYAGGTPLFDEVTSKAIDRYYYIINSHPELKDILNF